MTVHAALRIGIVALAFGLGLAGPVWAEQSRGAGHPVAPVSPIPAPPAHPAAPAPGLPPQAYTSRVAASEIELRNLAAIVVISPQDRADMQVTVTNFNVLPNPQIRTAGRKLIIDGALDRRIQACGANGPFGVQVRGRGWVREGALPVIEIRTPQNVTLANGGAVRLHIGPAQNAHLALAGCGMTDVERVIGQTEASVAGGDMQFHLIDTGSASLRLAGSNDVTIGAVRSGLELSVAGSGDVTVIRADGPTNIAVQGSGDVDIRDGRATTLSIAIAGSGDVTHNGEAQRLDAAIVGSGDVRVRRVTGQVNRHVFGSGDVFVGQ
ncbi:MAG TPA: DUF2807 domain-containing protein [Caulobacterales bacterium]|nr:DUF2807 domain-containing protein [Caulobacterales bacterium]